MRPGTLCSTKIRLLSCTRWRSAPGSITWVSPPSLKMLRTLCAVSTGARLWPTPRFSCCYDNLQRQFLFWLMFSTYQKVNSDFWWPPISVKVYSLPVKTTSPSASLLLQRNTWWSPLTQPRLNKFSRPRHNKNRWLTKLPKPSHKWNRLSNGHYPLKMRLSPQKTYHLKTKICRQRRQQLISLVTTISLRTNNLTTRPIIRLGISQVTKVGTNHLRQVRWMLMAVQPPEWILVVARHPPTQAWIQILTNNHRQLVINNRNKLVLIFRRVPRQLIRLNQQVIIKTLAKWR